MKDNTKAVLYVVATPIGNLEDITLRALDIIKGVDFIISEDTRTSIKLLNKYGIKKKQVSYYSPKEKYQALRIIGMMLEGNSAALLSENGTPNVSDPGKILINEACKNGIKVVPIPGPSALTALLSVNNLETDDVIFTGFLPKKKGQRKKKIQELIGSGKAFVFYESKYRISDSLLFIKEINEEACVFIGREMTKRHEEFISGNIGDVVQKFKETAILKGEFAVLCSVSKR